MRTLPSLTFSVTLCALALAACQPLATPLPPTAEVATSTPTTAPTATAEPPTPTPTLPEPTATVATATPTQNPINIIGVYTDTSPNGAWRAEGRIVSDPAVIKEQLFVIRADGTLTLTVIDEEIPEPYGALPIPAPFQWSADGQSLYWVHRVMPDGCPVEMNGIDLHRVDLTTGVSTQLLEHATFWLALTPDESAVAYRSGEGLAVLNLATTIKRDVAFTPIIDGTITTIVWAPDSASFVFGTMTNFCAEPAQRTGSLYQVNAKTLVLTPLLVDDARTLIPQTWETANALILEDKDEQRWQLGPATGEIAPAP